MSEFFAVIAITILAVISPGADFAVVTKNSYLYGRSIGVLTSIGIALGVLVHVTYTLVAINLIMKVVPNFLDIIKYIGAFYLIYLGYKTFTQSPIKEKASSLAIDGWVAFRNGFFTNALNPKTTLFVISTFTQIVNISTPQWLLISYGAFMSFAHFVWFAIVALLFSQRLIRAKMLSKQVAINRVISLILGLLGMILLLSNLE